MAMAYAFDELGIDRFCAMSVKVDNVRSRGLWTSLGLRIARDVEAEGAVDFEILRPEYVRSG